MPCFTAVESSCTLYMNPPRPARGRKAETECALIAAVDVTARVVHRERNASDIANLCQILDVNAVIGQLSANRLQIFALRAQIVCQPGEGAGFQRGALLLARL